RGRCAPRSRRSAASGGNGLDQGLVEPHGLEATRPEQVAPLSLAPLLAARDREHQQVEPLAAAGLVPGRDDLIEDQQPGIRPGCRADRVQDRRRALVVPVVQDRREDVDVALGDSLADAPFYYLVPV